MNPIAVPIQVRFCLGAIALSATMTLGLALAAEPGAIVESDETFKSRRKDYMVDVFAPSAPGKYPAIIVLHGADVLGGQALRGRPGVTHPVRTRSDSPAICCRLSR
jgi:hypothetical protein